MKFGTMMVGTVAFFAVTGSAWAGPFALTHKLAPFSEVRTAEAPASCENFSGKWKGSCEVGGKITQEEAELEQIGCSFLVSKTDSQVLTIGGNKTVNQVVPTANGSYYVVQTTESYQWGNDNKEISIAITAQGHMMDSADEPTVVALSGRIFKDGQSLKVVMNQGSDGVMSCTYQPE